MPTPAEELRQAADKLRTHAEGAAEGPWTVDGWGCIATARSEEVAEVWPLNNGDHNAHYIAVMHLGVGAALAKWLDSWVGVDIDEYAVMPEDLTHVLAVARAINGTTK
ncbi:hypothetical protein AB0900_31030 [Streptomyces cellulosae]